MRRQNQQALEGASHNHQPPVSTSGAQSGRGRVSWLGYAADDGRSVGVLQSFRLLQSQSLLEDFLPSTRPTPSGLVVRCTIRSSLPFSFLVGVALPYSIRSRLRKGATFPRMLLHTIWRSLLLVALGIFLRSLHSTQTYFTFEDTLTQIGLGYTFLFLAGLSSQA